MCLALVGLAATLGGTPASVDAAPPLPAPGPGRATYTGRLVVIPRGVTVELQPWEATSIDKADRPRVYVDLTAVGVSRALVGRKVRATGYFRSGTGAVTGPVRYMVVTSIELAR